MSKLPSVPAINPVPQGIERPFWSVMIPTYNCANYLVETLKSVLEQAPGPEEMHIEVIDDCSTKDDPEAVVRELGQGRVSFYRQPKNVGAQANFTTCIQRSRGQWVHILHGDDLVMPGFYSKLRTAIETEPSVGAAFCRHIYMDENGKTIHLSSEERETPGILENWLECIALKCLLQTPSIVVKRSVYEQLGGYHPELYHCADWEMWKRIATYFPVWYEPQPLASYRQHTASDSSRLITTGANIADIRKAIEVSQSYLPSSINQHLSAKAREQAALGAVQASRRLLAKGDTVAAQAQIEQALQCGRFFEIFMELGWLMFVNGQRQEATAYALQAILTQPFKIEGWKLLICATSKKLPSTKTA